jgi:membrane protease YdiL (CAAX protease family)
MIFRIKLHWWSSLLAAAVMGSVAWLLDGTNDLVGSTGSIWNAIGLGVLAGAACMVANYLLDRSLRIIFGRRYINAFETFALCVIGRMGPAEALAGGIMAGVGEEPLFRGVLLPLCGPPVMGILVAGVVFGLAHYLRREYYGFLIWGMGEGFVFGTLYVVTGSILVPAIAHGLFDTVGFLYFARLRWLVERPR